MVSQSGGGPVVWWEKDRPWGKVARGHNTHCQHGEGNFGGKSRQISLINLSGQFIEKAQEGENSLRAVGEMKEK